MELDVEPLKRAVRELEEFLEEFRIEDASGKSVLFRIKRAGLIKAFEFTYETAIRFIRRQLRESVVSTEELKTMYFRDMLRVAADSGLITDPVSWFDYRDVRNISSHLYDEEKTNQVLSTLNNFIKDVNFLLDEITRRRNAV